MAQKVYILCLLVTMWKVYCSICNVLRETETTWGSSKPAGQTKCQRKELIQFFQQKVTVMQTYILYGNKRQHLTFITEVMYSAMLIAVNLQLITLTFFAHRCNKNNGNKSVSTRSCITQKLDLHIQKSDMALQLPELQDWIFNESFILSRCSKRSS